MATYTPGALGIVITAFLPVQTPLVQALAVSSGIIVATGTNADMLALQSSATIVQDFRGAFILPVSYTECLVFVRILWCCWYCMLQVPSPCIHRLPHHIAEGDFE